MENVKQIDIKITAKSRPILAEYGKMYGHELYTVTKTNVDRKYHTRMQEADINGVLLTHRATVRYKIIRIDILSLQAIIDADGTPAIVINGGMKNQNGDSIEIIRSLEMPRFNIEPTTENISKAIESSVNGGEVLYFSNPEKLTEAINRLNKREEARIAVLIEELTGQQKLLNKTIANDTEAVAEYRRQLGQVDKPDTTVKVHVEV